jgi:hypothetical protein
MATLFVDCGDTLITGTRLFNARGEEAWQPNWDVVAAVERWQIQGHWVTWSSGRKKAQTMHSARRGGSCRSSGWFSLPRTWRCPVSATSRSMP